MPVRIVQSKQNARLKELRRALAQSGPPRVRRRRTGLAGIEGPNLLEEALRAGLRVSIASLPRRAPSTCWKPCLCRGDRDSAHAARSAGQRPGHRDAAARCRPGRAAGLDLGAPAGRPRQSCSAARGAGRIAGSRQPGHHSALRRGLRRRWRPQPAGNRERLEPQGGARLGRQRLPGSAAGCERRRVLCAPAEGRSEDLDHHRACGPKRPTRGGSGRAGGAAYRQ